MDLCQPLKDNNRTRIGLGISLALVLPTVIVGLVAIQSCKGTLDDNKNHVSVYLIGKSHIFPKAQVASNKNANNFIHHFQA